MVCMCTLIDSKECDEPEFPALRFTIGVANRFFRLLRDQGVLLGDPIRTEAMECSRAMCEACQK